MLGVIINSMVSAVVGVVAFVVTRNVLTSQDTATWTALERAIMNLVPPAIGILLLVGVFLGLTRYQTRFGGGRK
ncbi:MAG: hypothetical protein RMM10_13075 [Anaerolineae bacterium]|uniref:hypothetical protein n=1 Tax=Thermoflexus sp. TaxID=1969742 RepID=UPI0025EE222E|nr:hypothetical protein [Thermoflexus sp.]MCS7352412.1 hypothetical protein [Thermoflexus sp.]MDW8181878.1 hypothetical protein [Anaerolineae bacterium]